MSVKEQLVAAWQECGYGFIQACEKAHEQIQGLVPGENTVVVGLTATQARRQGLTHDTITTFTIHKG